MENRLFLTILSVIAGLLLITGIALPLNSYLGYRKALNADFRVRVEAEVTNVTVADADEDIAIAPSEKAFYAPVVHFTYQIPGEDASHHGQELIPYSKYWSQDAGKAKAMGEELHPVGSSMELYISETNPGRWALRPSEVPARIYLILTPIGLFLVFGGCFLLFQRARIKKSSLQAASPVSHSL